MRFFFPDSQDLVDPSFDFGTERRSRERLRHRDDVYAHQVFKSRAYDGLLVSKGIVDGTGPSSGKYTLAQRHRLLRVGARDFFRLADTAGPPLEIMGDCGAFTYLREKVPPYSVDEVLAFYDECRFDLGLSVDHVILGFQSQWDSPARAKEVPTEMRERQQLTLELARDFLTKHRKRRLRFRPIGVAQGWSPKSYARAVERLQKIGFDYIALGGMVPLKTVEILASLEAIAAVRRPTTRLHLLGITRPNSLNQFRDYGVVSFDSTSPLRQAFKDERDNYYAMDRTFTAVRVPQVEGNPGLQKRIKAGQVSQDAARLHERRCLTFLKEYDAGRRRVADVVSALCDYEKLYDPTHDHSAAYEEVLRVRPWRTCQCDVCRDIGYHVILFRGAERNRRRGFHNVWTFYRRLRHELGLAPPASHPEGRGQSRRSNSTTLIRTPAGIP
ncbi:MAG TPA: tRNA-guanine transglycosylase DpdA [Fimbriimonas sp.]|nr:tRNA-guanine transglycosylase DpdA [Fimbriimonas sp.]